MEIASTTAMPASKARPSQDQLHTTWRRPEEPSKQMTHFRNRQGKQGSGMQGPIKDRQRLWSKRRGSQGEALGTDPGQKGMRHHHQGDMAIPAGETAHLVVVQAQIFARLQILLNGLITNDKFCMSRTARLQLSHWRLPRSARQSSSQEVQSPVEEHVREYLPQQETYEKTTMESSSQLPGTA
jgi:hypothetical protein